MLRVMIIDDEKALRCLLKKIVPWEEYGMKVAGEASSGVEAINTIDEIAPHIVFVDIRMPFMDGIEFSKIAKERYPRLKIIVLTAYEEFEYAKQCIAIGVVDYLLKPVNRKEIAEILQKIKSEIGEEDEIEDVAGDKTEGNMGKICRFLEEQYEDPHMNLTSVAQKFGYHPSYLSRKFKEENGKSLIDYLTSYRMDQACICAKRGDLMYIAAEKTGIKDPNYFGKCFKKYKGISYSDYLKNLNEE